MACRGRHLVAFFRNPGNDLNHYPLLRALLVALDRWVTSGVEPPPSAFPPDR
ncbi:MAG: hypothetical protein CM1200mP2_37200 [Planctomycetaceae bacterium]|nr:MAG: hypothetical protein CM1200mP2_37200 [Planctomycetaceae bacterium]